MTYQIDQSGKVEQTNKMTVVCLANGESVTIKISAVEKQKLINTMLEINKPNRTYMYQIFACLIFLLLRRQKIDSVVIDQEYPSHNPTIKEVLLQLFTKSKTTPPAIDFGLIGKKCQAHEKALSVYQKKSVADRVVKAKEVLELLFTSTKNGWRPRPNRGNP